jgi:hypothetical protein
MTVVVAVRTGSAAVLAADSKLSSSSFVGKDASGTPQWAPQTYDHAVKIVKDRSSTSIAAFAGAGNIGERTAVDYFARLELHLHVPAQAQDVVIEDLINGMKEERAKAAKKLGYPAKDTPQTIALVAAPPADGTAPRLWRIDLNGDQASAQEILKWSGVWLEGSANLTLTLLYGIEGGRMEALQKELNVDPDTFEAAITATVTAAQVSKINFWTMPVQDAMDFAAFCARVEVEMERFLPGNAVCGGPIDLMTLEMAPDPTIRAFLGKTLHHPQQQ